MRWACRKHIHKPWNYRLHAQHAHWSATEPSLRLDQYLIPDMWQECHTMRISLWISMVVATPTSHGTYNFADINMPRSLPWISLIIQTMRKQRRPIITHNANNFYLSPTNCTVTWCSTFSISLSFHYSLSNNLKIIKQTLKIMCVSFMYKRHFKICRIMLHGKGTSSNVDVINH